MSRKARCNIRVYVPVRSPVPLLPPPYPAHTVGLNSRIVPHDPSPRSRILARKQLHDLPLGRTTPKGPNLEKNQSRNFNLAWNFQARPSELPTRIGPWWQARLKSSVPKLSQITSFPKLPWPSNPCFLEKKQGKPREKQGLFSLRKP